MDFWNTSYVHHVIGALKMMMMMIMMMINDDESQTPANLTRTTKLDLATVYVWDKEVKVTWSMVIKCKNQFWPTVI